jgi:hypothetical protein
MAAIRSSETSVYKRSTGRNIPENSILRLKVSLKEKSYGFLLLGKLAVLSHHLQKRKSWQSRRREYMCAIYFLPLIIFRLNGFLARHTPTKAASKYYY